MHALYQAKGRLGYRSMRRMGWVAEGRPFLPCLLLAIVGGCAGLEIAAFNIRVFGMTKLEMTEVVEVLSQVRYSVGRSIATVYLIVDIIATKLSMISYTEMLLYTRLDIFISEQRFINASLWMRCLPRPLP